MPALRIDLRPGSTLWLAEIYEPRTNDLRLVVLEVGPAKEEVETLLGPARNVEPDSRSKAFEITWYNYVAYSVRNESYALPEKSGVSTSGPVGIRRGSFFQKFVEQTTFASDDIPGPLTHWFVYADWHCIDIIGSDEPECRELQPEEIRPLLIKFRGDANGRAVALMHCGRT